MRPCSRHALDSHSMTLPATQQHTQRTQSAAAAKPLTTTHSTSSASTAGCCSTFTLVLSMHATGVPAVAANAQQPSQCHPRHLYSYHCLFLLCLFLLCLAIVLTAAAPQLLLMLAHCCVLNIIHGSTHMHTVARRYWRVSEAVR
jgi:hypothetical protein